MARTPSTMTPLGAPAPDFDLPETEGGRVSLRDFDGAPALLVMFICNHCPFVIHVREQLAALGRDLMPRGLAVVAISSNDAAQYPQDGFGEMREERRRAGYPFPYAYDETQEVARAYGAACTPDFFLYDAARRLSYRGQLDASRPGSGAPVTGEDLRAACEALLATGAVPADLPQRPSLGCNIKWRAEG